MTVALLAAAVIVTALTGPRLLRWGSPVLMRAPRLGSGLLLGALAVWSAAVMVLSLALAGLASGPRLPSGPFADVCHRCLVAASPFSSATPIDIPVPVAVLILLPLAVTLLMILLAARRLLRRAGSTRAVLTEVLATGERTEVAGHHVLLIPDPQPLAFALPRRRGGIVVSQGLSEVLDGAELSAVLAHEAAHLNQHHHALFAVLDALSGPLRAIPLFRAVTAAVPHLLEIAADNASRHLSGTPALASALLTLGGSGSSGPSVHGTAAPAALLQLTGPAGIGPDRIGHLVSPAAMRSALMPVLTLSSLLVMLIVIVLAIVGPYALLFLNGCALPL